MSIGGYKATGGYGLEVLGWPKFYLTEKQNLVNLFFVKPMNVEYNLYLGNALLVLGLTL